MHKTQFRQGDVLLVKVDSIPTNARPSKEVDKKRVVLQYGEVTGHAHALHNVKAVTPMICSDKEETLIEAMTASKEAFLSVTETSHLTHEEHGAITLEPGNYQVFRQSEYAPQELRFVND